VEIIPAIKDHKRTIIKDTTEKANILNSCFASVFCCDLNIPEIKLANSGESSIIVTKVIRKRLAKFERNKSVGSDGVPDEILKLGREVVTPYLARLLEISLSNATTPRDWKRATVVPIYKGGDRSAVSNNRPISFILWSASNWNTLYQGI